jgi:predicted nucleic acid-binding protein
MNAVDTTILLAIRDPRDPVRQSVAASLVLALPDAVLLWQVACEYLSACRTLEPFGYGRMGAWQDMRDLQQYWTTLLPTWRVLGTAERLSGRYSLSFHDALLVAACLEGGVTRLYTEEFDRYPRIETLELVNPFRSL